MNCKKCGAKALSELCFKCKPKKPLSSGKGLNRKMSAISNKKPNIVENNKHLYISKSVIELFKREAKRELLEDFFKLCWKNKPHYSEVSGKFLSNTCSSLYQHHILAKSKYPEACFDEENIVFLTADEHASVELDMYKYEYINKKREQLKIKYKLL
jgi:hypothetical protein